MSTQPPPVKGSNARFSKPSYAYSIVSIALVLFLLGIMCVLLMHAQRLSNHFKENLEIIVVLADDIAPANTQALQAEISRKPYTKSIEYVSKDEAAQQFMSQTKENFDTILGFNPLFASFNLYLTAAYANADSLRTIKSTLTKNPVIKEVFYQEAVVNLVNANVQRISIVLIILSVLFFGVAFILIDNTVKLAMYSNRFLIKSMQLVGATRWFITQPFITQSIYNGLISGMLASVLLALLLLLAQNNIPELSILHDLLSFVLICIIITLLGVFISWWSTKTSVVKYLQMQLDELY
ncbi:MAG TPA: permease-like cell division protein FtsX [Chitinophagales bacterium]|nr:permease-like cell division protein FtsX [Chitinophagales bacterium]